MLRAGPFLLLLALPLAAQAPRIIASLDGAPTDPVFTEGTARYVHDAGNFVEGRGALAIGPTPESAFYGVTLRELSGRSPRTLRLRVKLAGDRPLEWMLKIEEAGPRSDSGRDAAFHTVTVPPGEWRDVDIPLADLKLKGSGRALSTELGLGSLRFSRRKGADSDPAILVDGVAFLGEADGTDAAKRARAAVGTAGEPDGDARARALREVLPTLEDRDVVAVALTALERDQHERVRRAAREALGTIADDGAVGTLLQALGKVRGEARLELLWALGRADSAAARARAFELTRDPKTPAGEKTALLQGLVLRGAEDLGPLVAALPPTGPWPPRAALVRALAEAAVPASIDALIEVLRTPGAPRVAEDAEDALVRLTGKDLGADAKAWDAWWAVAKTARPDIRLRDRDSAREYAGFFGVKVGGGRTVFVLDISGSMRDAIGAGRAKDHVEKAPHLKGRKLVTRLDLAKAELENAVTHLPESAGLGAVVFNDEALWLTKQLERATTAARQKLVERMNGVTAGQKTNIHDGLRAAFHPDKRTTGKDDDGPDTIFLLSDGAPSTGPIARSAELRDAVLRWNLGRMIRIHVVNVGDNDDRATLAALATASGGVHLDLSSDPAPKKGG